MRRTTLLVGAVVVVVAGAVVVSGASSAGSGQARWVMRDLGTLGGAWSEAVAVNERGQIVGTADTETNDKDGDPIRHAFLWDDGKMRDLGALHRSTSSSASAINDHGQVVGSAETGASNRYYGRLEHAVMWQNGRIRDLGTLGGPTSHAIAINERGQIVGRADTGTKDEDGYGGYVTHWFIWQNGRMRDLDVKVGDSSVVGINDLGQVVGSGDRASTAPLSWFSFLWEKGRMRDLGDFDTGEYFYRFRGLTPSVSAPINDRGQIAGRHGNQAALWQDGKVRELGTLGPRWKGSWACSINNHGHVIGNSKGHTFLWRNGKMTDLTPTEFASGAVALNERGQVIAWVRRHSVWAKNYAIVWQNGRAADLPDRGRWGSTVADINNHGQIVGRSGNADFSTHAVLWTLRSG